MSSSDTEVSPIWTEIMSRGRKTEHYLVEDFGGLEFHHLSLIDTLSLTKAMQKSQKHLDSYLPFFDKKEGKTVPKIQRWISSMLNEQFPAMHFVFTLSGKVCGFGSTLAISADPREVQLRYLVFDGYQGRGLATRIAATLELMAFQVWGYDRVFIEMDSHNRASIKVAEKLGYRFRKTKEMPLFGSQGSGFWYSYSKERDPQSKPGVLQSRPMEDFNEEASMVRA